MEVYVRPMEWEGTEEERPIQQLLVTLEHKVNGTPVRVAQALRTTDEKCTFRFPSFVIFLIRTEYRDRGVSNHAFYVRIRGPESRSADA